MSVKLRQLVKESKVYDEEETLSIEDKREFINNVKKFNEYSDIVGRNGSLREIVDELDEFINIAKRIALDEVDEWFDKVSLNRDMKQLEEEKKLFKKTAKEITQLQSRLESCYQGIGNVLTKYYDLGE
jgi:hypothetical protein